MTDKEIIKALECCKKNACDNCPNNFGNCYANLAGYALALINRYEAENERLEDTLKIYHKYNPAIRHAKSEAIKEFAERLKAKAYTNNYCQEIVLKDAIDTLAKEMTGETKTEKTYCAVCGGNGYVSKHSDNSIWSEQCPSCRGETKTDTDFPKDYSYGY